MKVIRSGGPASRTVVEDHPPLPEIGREPEKCLDVSSDGLAAMVHMGNGEVGGQYRCGIAEDQKFISIKDPLLFFRETIQAEETPLFVCILLADIGGAALDSSGIVLNADGKSPARHLTLSAAVE
jgi:hypothetical protein